MAVTKVRRLRQVGQSVMIVVPRAYLAQLNLEPGDMVGLTLEQDHLVLRAERAENRRPPVRAGLLKT